MEIAIVSKDKVYQFELEKRINEFFSNYEACNIESLTHDELQESLELNECHYDLAFLEVQMEDNGSIEMAMRINRLNPQCHIIFISNRLETVTKTFDASYVYFFLKNELDLMLPKALAKVKALIHKRPTNHYLNYKYNKKAFFIPLDEIIYIEIRGRKLYIYTIMDTYTSNQTLKNVSQDLPEDFIRVHNSYMVNKNYIRHMCNNNCILINHITVPISRTYKNNVVKVIKKISDGILYLLFL